MTALYVTRQTLVFFADFVEAAWNSKFYAFIQRFYLRLCAFTAVGIHCFANAVGFQCMLVNERKSLKRL